MEHPVELACIIDDDKIYVNLVKKIVIISTGFIVLVFFFYVTQRLTMLDVPANSPRAMACSEFAAGWNAGMGE